MIIRADARAIPLVDACVDCVVTSPPYWGLRDYGDADQIGLEATPDLYVAALVDVFREVARVLNPRGTVWLNLGDSYANQTGNNKTGLAAFSERYDGRKRNPDQWATVRGDMHLKPAQRPANPFGAKQLVGISWRVAFALQADGWILRSDLIWHKPNPMPESVTDRPTRSHEFVFLLARSERYWYDAAAIEEARVWDQGRDDRTLRNRRSVWTIPLQPYTEAHFATFPEALVEPCILAGCPIGGLVLDPFLGSGTVGAVAERCSRRWVGTDLAYHDLSRDRTAQRGLRFAEAHA